MRNVRGNLEADHLAGHSLRKLLISSKNRPLSRACCDRSSGRRAVARRTASAGETSCLASFEVAAIVGRCFPCDPMKGSAERARATESHTERNLGDRCVGVRQQGLGAFNPPARPVAIWGLPEGLLEGSQKMIWAEPHQVSEHVKRNFLGKVLLDEIHDALLLPHGEPATWRRP